MLLISEAVRFALDSVAGAVRWGGPVNKSCLRVSNELVSALKMRKILLAPVPLETLVTVATTVTSGFCVSDGADSFCSQSCRDDVAALQAPNATRSQTGAAPAYLEEENPNRSQSPSPVTGPGPRPGCGCDCDWDEQ